MVGEKANGSVMALRQTAPCVNGEAKQVNGHIGSFSEKPCVKRSGVTKAESGAIVGVMKDQALALTQSDHTKLWDEAVRSLKEHLGPKFLQKLINKYSRSFFNMMTVPTLRVGCVGLGRMGKRHAQHFLEKVDNATLVAVCTIDKAEYDWAVKALEPKSVKVYDNFDDMLKHEGMEALVIASVTKVHADQTIKAINAGKHVLCEKPLSLSAEESQRVVDAANDHPELKVMCGFSRRFDESYRDAYKKMSKGVIGTPSVFRSQTCDKWDEEGKFIEYARFSGGIFVDCSIHDIDLCLWFFGQDAKVKSVYAGGITAKAPELRKHNDVDNAVGIVEFWGEKFAYLYCSRMMAAGQEDTTEIIGTGGKLTVNVNPRKNHVSMHIKGGIVTEIPADYFERFEKAFITEGIEFTEACLKDRPLPMKLSNAVDAVNIGRALQDSLISGQKIDFDENGVRKNKARL